jgi:hypothetical protein
LMPGAGPIMYWDEKHSISISISIREANSVRARAWFDLSSASCETGWGSAL